MDIYFSSKKSDLENEVEHIYLRYCEAWSQDGTQMHEFVNAWVHDDCNFPKTRLFRCLKKEGFQEIDCLKARKMLLLLLIKRATKIERQVTNNELGFMIRNLISLNKNYLKGYFKFYGSGVFERIQVGRRNIRFPLWFFLVCYRDYLLRKEGRSGAKCLQLDNYLDLFKEKLNLSDEDLRVDYNKHLKSCLSGIPDYCLWDIKQNSRIATEIDSELIISCKQFDLKNVERCLSLGANPLVEIGDRTLFRYLKDKIASISWRMNNHTSIADVSNGMFFLSLYQQEYSLLKRRFEEMKEELILSDPVRNNLLVQSNVICDSIRKYHFDTFDNLKPLFNLFPSLSMEEGYYLDGFTVKRGSRRGELRLYARKVGLYKIWGKTATKYIDGQHIRNNVSEEREKLVPSIFEHVLVPFTTMGVWEAFLLWLAPRVEVGLFNDRYNKYYITALSHTGISNLIDYYERLDENLLPSLAMISNDCYEVRYPWVLRGHSFQRKRVCIFRKGTGVVFSDPEDI